MRCGVFCVLFDKAATENSFCFREAFIWFLVDAALVGTCGSFSGSKEMEVRIVLCVRIHVMSGITNTIAREKLVFVSLHIRGM